MRGRRLAACLPHVIRSLLHRKGNQDVSIPPTWKALKQLSEVSFDANRVEEFIREVNEGNDRAVAIVWSAMAEDALDRMMMRWMDHLTSDEKSVLSGHNSPISTFAGKIIIARVMGLLSKDDRKDLDIVRLIRNAFAHSAAELSFSTKEVADMCAQLSIVSRIKPGIPVNPRACYCATCLRLWGGMGGFGVHLMMDIATGEVSS